MDDVALGPRPDGQQGGGDGEGGNNQGARPERRDRPPRQRRDKDHHESGTGRPVNEGPKRGGAGRGNVGKPVDVDARDKSVEDTVRELEASTETLGTSTPQAMSPEPVEEQDKTMTLSEYMKKQGVAPETRTTVREVQELPGMQRKSPVGDAQGTASDKHKHNKKKGSSGEQAVRVDEVLNVRVSSPVTDDRFDRRRGPREAPRTETRGPRRAASPSQPLFVDDKSFPALGKA